MGFNMKNVKKVKFLPVVGVHVRVNNNGLNKFSLSSFINNLWWSIWFALDKYEVYEISMWHRETNGILIWKLGSFWGVVMWNIVEVHDDRCATLLMLDDSLTVHGGVLAGSMYIFFSSAFHEVCDGLWRCFKRSENGYIAGLIGVNKVNVFFINAEWNPVVCSEAKSLQLCGFAFWSC